MYISMFILRRTRVFLSKLEENGINLNERKIIQNQESNIFITTDDNIIYTPK